MPDGALTIGDGEPRWKPRPRMSRPYELLNEFARWDRLIKPYREFHKVMADIRVAVEEEQLRIEKNEPLRDRAYLDSLRQEPCIFTGIKPGDCEAVDPMHIGTAGKGLKSGDDEALPVAHWLHVQAHQDGEVSMIREYAPDWLLREAFRAYAREKYRKWRDA